VIRSRRPAPPAVDRRRAVVRLALIGAGLATLLTPASAAGPATTPSEPRYDLDALYREVRAVVRRYYPEATAHRLDRKIHFEHDTRVFVVHEPLKTGEWQDPWEERGPRQRGIIADIEIVPGRWRGAAVVPQSFDRRYFTHHLMAPYSETLDAHLYVSIKYPRTVPDGFLRELADVLNHFDRYVTRNAG
jgi:hypothetical protein